MIEPMKAKTIIKIQEWVNKLSCLLIFICIIAIVWKPIIAFADNGDTIVHVTNTGKCYHTAGCYHLRSDREITLYEAVVENGYNPCIDCNPPIYDGPEPLHEKMEKSQSSSSSKSNNTANSKEKTDIAEKDEEGEPLFLKVIIGVMACFLGLKLIGFTKRTYKKWRIEKELFLQEQNRYMTLYANKDPLSLVDIPKDSFIKDGYPCSNGNGPYGDYTVYIAKKNGKVLHVKPKCGGVNLAPTNYAKVYNLPHCKRCASGKKIKLPKIGWYQEYIEITRIKKKYQIP